MNESHNPVESTRAKARAVFTKEQRAAHLSRWQSSGLSGAQYSRQSGIREVNLYRWRSNARDGHAQVAGSNGDGSSFMRLDLERTQLQGSKSALAAPSDGVANPQHWSQNSPQRVSATLPVVTLRYGELELAVSEATSTGQLVEVLRAIRREVLYV